MTFLIRFMDESGQIELQSPTLANAQKIVEFLKRSKAEEITVSTIDGDPVDIDPDAASRD